MDARSIIATDLWMERFIDGIIIYGWIYGWNDLWMERTMDNSKGIMDGMRDE